MTDRQKAFTALENLRSNGVSDSKILDYLINDFFSGSQALDAMVNATEEFFPEPDEEED